MRDWQKAILAMFFIFGAIGVVAWIGGFIPVGKEIITIRDREDTELPGTACIGGETQSLDVNIFVFDTPTSALTEDHNIFRTCGSVGSLGTWTQGTALTGLNTGGCYELLPGVSATSTDRYDNNYGAVIRVDNLPCVFETSIGFFNDELEGSLTAAFYNSNHDASPETTVANTPVVVYLKWYGADKEYYGNPYVGLSGTSINYLDLDLTPPAGITYVKGSAIKNHRPEYPNTLCLQLNSTEQRVPKWVKAQLQDGSVVEMNRVGTPTVQAAAAGHIDYCYEAPIVTGTFIEFRVKIDPKIIAVADDTASLYAASWFGHTDTGVTSWGVEDNDGNAIGASDPDTLTLDWTA